MKRHEQKKTKKTNKTKTQTSGHRAHRKIPWKILVGWNYCMERSYDNCYDLINY